RCANTENQVAAIEISSPGEVNNQPMDLISLAGNSLMPDLFPLIDITQHDIDTIVEQVEGGAANIKDIYALSPLQEGVLFHHAMMAEGDPYLVATLMSFDNRDALDRYIVAFQKVIDRHDIFRSAFVWEQLSRPAQVVLRHAPMSIAEISLNPVNGPVSEQLAERFNPRGFRINLAQAPLIRAVIAKESDDRWVLLQLMHHTIDDQYTRTQIQVEIRSILEGKVEALSLPQPFRDYIAQIRSGPSDDDHKHFFTKMLADIDTPALPFGFSDVHHGGLDVTGSLLLPQDLSDRLRGHATRMGVSVARICHLAWAVVVARTSGQERVVFGTLISGRQRSGTGGSTMGPMINTLPIRVDVMNASVEESLYQIKSDISSLIEHKHASLTLAQRCSGVPAGTPLFSSLFNYRYKPSLVEALDHAPNKQVRDLDVMPTLEREMLIQSWKTTTESYPLDQCVHQIFEDQVRQSPDAIAIVYENQQMSYGELNARANSLAHHLIDLGVKPDSLVAICVDRSPAMIIGLLAILKAGGAYVPLDPTFASERLQDTLVDASPLILLADEVGIAALGSSISESIVVVDPNVRSKMSIANPLVPELTPEHLAYVIYTSGSTGKPKGVMLEHQGVANLAASRPKVFGVDFSSKVLQFFSLSFDASVHEIWSALCHGGSLHILTNSIRQDLALLWNYLEQQSITHAILTPTLLQHHENLSPLHAPLTLILGGEALSSSLIKSMRKLISNGSIINDYGPTEITVDAIAWKCPEDFNGDIAPIGRPHPNKRIYVLDSHRKLVPMGAIGELYIAGAGVARGYLNRPDLTEKAFFSDPFTSDIDSRMYKTGDLVRYLPDGNLMFLGRDDHQVKIRGYRLELGEIEARLLDHISVRESVVLALGEGSSKRLVAYVVADFTEELVHTLRSYISTKLPEYMVPAAFVRMDVLPLTPNGKLDRRALPEPSSDAFVSQGYEAPQDEIESTLAVIWSDILKVDRVGRHDNFFMLGGHSLLAVRLMNRVSALGVNLQLSTLFASPILSELANVLANQFVQENQPCDPITPISRDGTLPLSFAQQRLWFLAQMEGVSDIYHIPMAIRLQGTLNRDAWQSALSTMFARHESLRSTFVNIEGEPQVLLLPAELGVPMITHDLRSELDIEVQLHDLKKLEAGAPFDLEKGPLIRSRLIQVDDDDHVILLTQHHIVSDGWSLGLMTRELSELYTAYCGGQSNPLPQLKIQYPDYASWQRDWLSGGRLQEQSDFWRATLADAPVSITLPTDRPRPPQQSFAGAHVPICVDMHTTLKLKQLSQQNGTTLFMTIMAAWSAVLSRLSGQDDVMIGTPSANRNHPDVEQLIGFFVNTLVLRVDLSGNPSVSQLLERVRQCAVAAQAHQDLPFEQVVEIAQPPRRMDQSPLFQVMFAWQNNEEGKIQLPGMALNPTEMNYDVVKFDLDLSLCESNGEIVGGLSYSTALFDRPTIERHVGYLQTMLQAMVDATQSIGAVDILSSSERELLLQTSNATNMPYPDHLCIHQIFESQVVQSPDAIAVVFEDQQISYGELNARANSLAHRLIGLGLKPDSLVAICVDRSLVMIIGLLAILKAGGAYVPLDPSFASERLHDILIDAAPSILVADDAGIAALGSSISESIVVVDPSVWSEMSIKNPLILELTSQHLAYVIYTSGSTGKPKGVMIEHHGVTNLAMSRPSVFGVGPSSRVLQFFSFSFDGSVQEIWSALCFGGRLHVLHNGVRHDQAQLWDYLEKHSITQATLTPTVLQHHQTLPPLNSPLNLVLAGEAVPSTMIKVLRRLIPNGTIYNDYGPTETTVAAAAWKCPEDFSGDIAPIGQPSPNKRLYVLDSFKKPVPFGVVGELYIAGAGVARGYLNSPDLTDKSFLPDPFAQDIQSRMYKTGDL
ncbi:hypothetical protein BGX26_002079, partial [Mortierella sp. AD094]